MMFSKQKEIDPHEIHIVNAVAGTLVSVGRKLTCKREFVSFLVKRHEKELLEIARKANELNALIEQAFFDFSIEKREEQKTS